RPSRVAALHERGLHEQQRRPRRHRSHRSEPGREILTMNGFARALLLPLGLACAAPVPAQVYPTRPIRFITAAAQGGTSDILARIFAVHLTESLKQPVVVDNRASASGVIAGELTANAPPDGYTLLLAYHQHTVNAALNP